MRAWLESIAGPEYASAMMWTLGALILLLVILIIVRIVRGLTFGTFVAGGRNRKTRLAVMDATAVDTHRRLVLVRRDDVEHLILIGGPTDVVVEQNIRLQTPARRVLPPEPRERQSSEEFTPRQAPDSMKPPAAAAELPSEPARRPAEPQRPAPAPAPAPPTAAPATSTQPTPAARPSLAAATPKPTPAPVAPVVPSPPAPGSTASPAASGAAASTTSSTGKSTELDDALLQELEVTLGEKKPAAESGEKREKGEEKVDDEMSRLLGELSTQRSK
jgi:hypothetical protein